MFISEKSKNKKTVIIGAGASGLMAAYFSAASGAETIVLDKNEKTGKKIYITGKGRCNVTNECDCDEFMRHVTRNPRFLYAALSNFSPADTMAFFEESGVMLKTERGRRVFPQSDHSSDIIRALTERAQRAGARIMLRAEAESVRQDESGRFTIAVSGGGSIDADAVIIASGGLSYPATGSTGDGYRIAESFSHTIVTPVGSLVPIITKEEWPKALQGLSLKNVTLNVKRGKKTIFSELGEMLFTHFGISGPLVLEASSALAGGDTDNLSVYIDLKPALTPEQLDARLSREIAENPRRQLDNILPSLLPSRLAELFPTLLGLDGSVKAGQITREDRLRIGELLKRLPITIDGFRPVEEAIVTRGGVSVKEVDSSTMQSKLVRGLYFSGEVLDLDAHTGGYNLQIAFSTGALAGKSAASPAD